VFAWFREVVADPAGAGFTDVQAQALSRCCCWRFIQPARDTRMSLNASIGGSFGRQMKKYSPMSLPAEPPNSCCNRVSGHYANLKR
jgi:hypothetical protein